MAPFLDTGQIGIKEESFLASCVLPVGPLVMSVRAPIRVERAGFFESAENRGRHRGTHYFE